MKYALILSLSLISTNTFAEQKIVPLDMDLGYWETTTEIEESEMIKKMLENLPASQKEMFRKTMKSQFETKVSKQCITEESLKDMEKQMKESLGSVSKKNDCELKITETSSTVFSGALVCQGIPTTIYTKVISSKKLESKITTTVPGMGENNITSIGEWKSASCPAGV